jgi:hypothetical protein
MVCTEDADADVAAPFSLPPRDELTENENHSPPDLAQDGPPLGIPERSTADTARASQAKLDKESLSSLHPDAERDPDPLATQPQALLDMVALPVLEQDAPPLGVHGGKR